MGRKEKKTIRRTMEWHGQKVEKQKAGKEPRLQQMCFFFHFFFPQFLSISCVQNSARPTPRNLMRYVTCGMENVPE